MNYCDNPRCKHNQRGMCLNFELVIENERCRSFEAKWKHRQKKTNQTDINHEPVVSHKRNGVLK
jgi:hypothetical protein